MYYNNCTWVEFKLSDYVSMIAADNRKIHAEAALRIAKHFAALCRLKKRPYLFSKILNIATHIHVPKKKPHCAVARVAHAFRRP